MRDDLWSIIKALSAENKRAPYQMISSLALNLNNHELELLATDLTHCLDLRKSNERLEEDYDAPPF